MKTLQDDCRKSEADHHFFPTSPTCPTISDNLPISDSTFLIKCGRNDTLGWRKSPNHTSRETASMHCRGHRYLCMYSIRMPASARMRSSVDASVQLPASSNTSWTPHHRNETGQNMTTHVSNDRTEMLEGLDGTNAPGHHPKHRHRLTPSLTGNPCSQSRA